MSKNAQIITWVVVAVVVVGGGIWWYLSSAPTATAPAAYVTPTSTPAMNQPATSTPTSTTNGVSATDTSNAALQADLSNVDTQTNSFSGDNASITQGMNDQETQQSQIQ